MLCACDCAGALRLTPVKVLPESFVEMRNVTLVVGNFPEDQNEGLPCNGSFFCMYQNMRFVPTQGAGGHLLSTIKNFQCKEDAYYPSDLEKAFTNKPASFFDNQQAVCDTLGNTGNEWIEQNIAGIRADNKIFSKICRKGQYAEYVEPLAGILRNPRFPCGGNSMALKFNIDWLVMADFGNLQGGTNRFFDAGCTHFSDALNFFTKQYQGRGIIFDEVYAWEYVIQDYEAFWAGVDSEDREYWEPRVTFYNGIPVTSDKGAEHNVVDKIHRMCKPNDFCAFKLDIDTPEVELPLVQQLLDQASKTKAALNEFFFEHHVHGIMQHYGWGANVAGTFVDSYRIFKKLREMGVRAHSWI